MGPVSEMLWCFENTRQWTSPEVLLVELPLSCAEIAFCGRVRNTSLGKVFFWTLSIVYTSIKLRFGSWIFFRLQVK
jgi:hypothetical protein